MRKTLIILIVMLSVCLAGLLSVAIFVGPIQMQNPTIQPEQTIPPTQTTPQTTQTVPATTEPAPDYDAIIADMAMQIPAEEGFDGTFLYWLQDYLGDDVILSLDSALESGYHRGLWYEATGNSYHALKQLYTNSECILVSAGIPGRENKTTSLIFGGDICLADNYGSMQYLQSIGGTIETAIDPALIDIFKKADVSFLVNEFTISDRGTPMKDKYYTFRAKTANAAIYRQLGINLVTLANNHVYDFGKDAFLDTLDALKANGVAYIGGGKNLEEAMKPRYYVINGRVVAFVAASRAEKFKMTPEAGQNSPGILRCYDTTRLCQAIAEAKANSDFVVACVHWGLEYEYTLQQEQTTSAREYIDAGADAIIGSHAHQLQAIEYYNGKPIFYNLGNFWFNEKEIETGLVEIAISHDGTPTFKFLPALQKDYVTSSQIGTDLGKQILANLQNISINVTIDENGVVTH